MGASQSKGREGCFGFFGSKEETKPSPKKEPEKVMQVEQVETRGEPVSKPEKVPSKESVTDKVSFCFHKKVNMLMKKINKCSLRSYCLSFSSK